MTAIIIILEMWTQTSQEKLHNTPPINIHTSDPRGLKILWHELGLFFSKHNKIN